MIYSINNKANIIIAGTVSNVERSIKNELNRIFQAFNDFNIIKIVLIESDSKDKTIEILGKVAEENHLIKILSLGKLNDKIPNRIERIRYCRNAYVHEIRSIMNHNKTEFVAILDLDGMNSKLSAKAVQSCFTKSGWTGVLANQTLGYYDILALRCKNWVESDCLQNLNSAKVQLENQAINSKFPSFWLRTFLKYDKLRRQHIYKHMRRISVNSPWIEVESGFGGLAIYKSEVFDKFDYSASEEDFGKCEHLALSNKIRNNGGRIFINPMLINCHWNPHNLNKFFLVRLIRLLVRDLRSSSKF